MNLKDLRHPTSALQKNLIYYYETPPTLMRTEYESSSFKNSSHGARVHNPLDVHSTPCRRLVFDSQNLIYNNLLDESLVGVQEID